MAWREDDENAAGTVQSQKIKRSPAAEYTMAARFLVRTLEFCLEGVLMRVKALKGSQNKILDCFGLGVLMCILKMLKGS